MTLNMNKTKLLNYLCENMLDLT